MNCAMVDVSLFGGDLDAGARRRLWLLAQLIEHCGLVDLESTLCRAEQLEEFVVAGRRAGRASSVDGGHIVDHARLGDPPAQLSVSREAAVGSTPARAGIEEPRPRQALLLDDNTRHQFIAEALRNPDNQHLAAMFGLTVRQAHAVQVAFRKKIAAARAAQDEPEGQRNIETARAEMRSESARSEEKPAVQARTARFAGFKAEGMPALSRPASTGPSLLGKRQPSRGRKRAGPDREMDRATELRLQNEFLAGKPSAPHTTEDVIRFLRQQGDIVVTDGNGYRVNYAQRLGPDELVARANDKRADRGLPPFALPCADLPPLGSARALSPKYHSHHL
jgi:hypothetical protein